MLKTKGRGHSSLQGFCCVRREYPDLVVEDSFYAGERIREAEDGEGNCYDWYRISQHNRTVDRFTPARGGIEAGISEAQDALCGLSADVEGRLAALEAAVFGEGK